MSSEKMLAHDGQNSTHVIAYNHKLLCCYDLRMSTETTKLHLRKAPSDVDLRK